MRRRHTFNVVSSQSLVDRLLKNTSTAVDRRSKFASNGFGNLIFFQSTLWEKWTYVPRKAFNELKVIY